jgi:hypothetical protein
MNYIILGIVVVFALAGAFVGWRRATANIYNPPGNHDVPFGTTRREHFRTLTRRYRRWRIPLTLAYAVGGGALGFGILMVYAVFIRR